MKKFKILFYHHSGQCYSTLHVIAKDGKDARRVFGLMYPIDWIEEVDDYDDEPRFWTEEEILALKKKL